MLRRNDNGKIICDRPDCLCHTDQEQRNILTPDQPAITKDWLTESTLDQMLKKTDPTNGTAGHSKGKWYYYGDVACGIATDCQHKADDLVTPVKFVFSSHQHESDDLIPMLTEEDFDNLSAAEEDIEITWDQYRANLRLMALAQHAPHDCGDPECPGVINKRKLELYDRFQECIKGFADAGLLT